MGDVIELEARRSNIVYVTVRLRVDGNDHFLLHAHPKWGDWSFVGGHVEADELHDWMLAAERETEEEMAPLQTGKDVRVRPLLPNIVTWGPTPSRSAEGAPTHYSSRWYWLQFRTDPVAALAKLDPSKFALAPQESLDELQQKDVITSLFKRLASTITYGLGSVPCSWNEDLSSEALGIRILQGGADSAQQA